jgi:hypothetical protein
MFNWRLTQTPYNKRRYNKSGSGIFIRSRCDNYVRTTVAWALAFLSVVSSSHLAAALVPARLREVAHHAAAVVVAAAERARAAFFLFGLGREVRSKVLHYLAPRRVEHRRGILPVARGAHRNLVDLEPQDFFSAFPAACLHPAAEPRWRCLQAFPDPGLGCHAQIALCVCPEAPNRPAPRQSALVVPMVVLSLLAVAAQPACLSPAREVISPARLPALLSQPPFPFLLAPVR